MKISKLLERHLSAAHPNGLRNSLGDTYLCQHNKIYRNIRKSAIKLGYRFSSEHNEAYQALPLSQLGAIIKSKIIPYLDNVTVLQQIEVQIPAVAGWEDIQDNLRKNFLFHESCHAVAHALAANLNDEDQVLKMLIEESFANTCELLAVLYADDSVHRIFCEWNSYTALFDLRTNLKNAVEEIGEDVLVRLIFFGYLHSNFLYNSMDENHLSRLLKLATEKTHTAKQLKTIRSILKICFTLDAGFKEVTTRFYMRLNGVRADHRKFIKANYIQSFEENPKYRDYVNCLISTITAS